MGVRNYLVEGLSGAGKTTVAEALERRGYDVVHGDRTLAYYGDPQTGEALDWPSGLDGMERIAWGYARWIWPVGKVRALLADHSHAVTFFCGGSRNSQHFIDGFDAVFFLAVDSATLDRRLALRPEDEFGGKPLERDHTLQLNDSGDYVPPGAIIVDAGAPAATVVETILARCGLPTK